MVKYILFVNLYALLFWLVYTLIQRKQKSYSLNKTFLFTGIILSLALPFISGFSLFQINIADFPTIISEAILITSKKNLNENKSIFSLNHLLLIIYTLIVIIHLLIIKRQSAIIKNKIRQKGYQVIDNNKVILNTTFGPGNYGKYIFFPDQEINPLIFKHEKAHIKLGHHREKMMLKIMKAFLFWMIPFHFIYKEILIIQEFEADELAKEDPQSYIELLLNAHFSTQLFSIIQPFYFQPLKRRIMMLKNQKNQSLQSKIRFITLGLAITCGILVMQNSNIIAQNVPKQVDEKGVYNHVEEMPEFAGGTSALSDFLSSNIKYPDKALADSISGRVIVTFIINEDGKVSDAKIIHSLSKELNEEVLRVVNSMPAWTPGKQNGKPVKVYYTLPVVFQAPQ